MNALLALRPCKAFGRSTSGIHARPRKRGGGTADKILWLAVQYSDSPAFTILKLFRALTVGIVNEGDGRAETVCSKQSLRLDGKKFAT